MSQLDDATVRHVAHLARIAVTDEEVRLFGAQLSKILDYVNQLNELDTSGVTPTAHPHDAANVFAPDVPRTPWTPDQALLNAPARHGDFFRVPRVLDQSDA